MRSYAYSENFKKFKGIQYDKDGSLMYSFYFDADTSSGREVYIITKDEIICYRSYVSKEALKKKKEQHKMQQQQSQQGGQSKEQESDGTKLAKAGLEFAADMIIDGAMQSQGMAKRVQPQNTGPFAGSDKSLNHMDRFFKYKGKKIKVIEPNREKCEIVIRKSMGNETLSTTEEDFDEILSHIKDICPNANVV